MIPDRGHASLAHTSDVILRAWAPDVAGCFTEAMTALIESFVDPTGAVVADERSWHISSAPPDQMLLDLLDELIFLLDTADGVPVEAAVTQSSENGFDVTVGLAAVASVEPTGAVPKAVSRSEIRFEVGADCAQCSFLVDV